MDLGMAGRTAVITGGSKGIGKGIARVMAGEGVSPVLLARNAEDGACFDNQIGTAPMVVRFQGARLLGSAVDPCNIPLSGIDSAIAQNSLTGWVEHPSDLNGFVTAGGPQSPNIFRFVVIWDATATNFDSIEAVEEIQVRLLPD